MGRGADRILIVEDEKAQRQALRTFLQRREHEVDAVETGEEAVELIGQRAYGVMVTDLNLPGIDGLTVMRRVREIDSEIGVLLITAFASLESAVEALRAGAHDYLLKPLILEEVERKIRLLLDHRQLRQENALLRRLLQARQHTAEVVAESPAMKEVLDWVRRAAASRATVLLTGETGTGKEVVARAIHRLGDNAEAPFLPLNLAAVPYDMVESELFGHEKGAYTGAMGHRRGALRATGSGTVFLDEIAELPEAVQVKLLRVLESDEIRPLGSDTPTTFQARIIAATHRDILAMVQEGRFREDLYYRLNVIHIRIPPLRERPQDVPSLAHALLARHASRGGVAVPLVTADAMRALCSHTWRGNVRELSNVLERALILADDGRVDLGHLPGDVRGEEDQNLRLSDAVGRAERAHIATVLRLCDGNRDRAAEELGISPATLYRRLEKHRLGAPEATDSQS